MGEEEAWTHLLLTNLLFKEEPLLLTVSSVRTGLTTLLSDLSPKELLSQPTALLMFHVTMVSSTLLIPSLFLEHTLIPLNTQNDLSIGGCIEWTHSSAHDAMNLKVTVKTIKQSGLNIVSIHFPIKFNFIK